MIEHECTECGATVESSSYLSGKKDQCPSCHELCDVPVYESPKKPRRGSDSTGNTRRSISGPGKGCLIGLVLVGLVVAGAVYLLVPSPLSPEVQLLEAIDARDIALVDRLLSEGADPHLVVEPKPIDIRPKTSMLKYRQKVSAINLAAECACPIGDDRRRHQAEWKSIFRLVAYYARRKAREVITVEGKIRVSMTMHGMSPDSGFQLSTQVFIQSGGTKQRIAVANETKVDGDYLTGGPLKLKLGAIYRAVGTVYKGVLETDELDFVTHVNRRKGPRLDRKQASRGACAGG